MAQRITVRKIATALGMSPSTVSQALNNKGLLRAETRERVISKAKEMGYYSASDPFGVDRVLSGRPIWFWPSGMRDSIPYAALKGFPAEVWQGAQDVFQPYRTVLCVVGEDDLKRGPGEEVVGTIVTGGYVSETMAQILRVNERPTVIVGSHVEAGTGVCCVECDMVEGIRMAIEHLHELGHRRIGFVNGPGEWRSSDQKLTGFVRGAFDYRLSTEWVTCVDDPWDRAAVTERIRDLLANEWRDVTAVVCAYESVGVSVVQAACSLGLHVPQQLSIVTCHDEGASRTADPPLTTIALPVRRMGKLAALLVISASRNKDVMGTRFVVPPTLVVRQSTAPPRP